MITSKEFVSGVFGEKRHLKSRDKDLYIVHLHALDVVKHVLKADMNDTKYQASYHHEKHGPRIIEECRAGMEKAAEKADYEKILTDQYAEVGKRWREERSDNGEIAIDRFIERDELSFDEPIRVKRDKAAKCIFFDIGVNSSERSYNYMVDRHNEIYQIALHCQAEEIPCKVICAYHLSVPEAEFRFYMTIKDWTDPIFPGIWGAFTDNVSTNAFLNLVSMYLVGTSDMSNGSLKTFNVKEQFRFDDIELIQPRYLEARD